MPTYDFECGHCGRRDERAFSMSDMPDAVPCACGQSATRVMSLNSNGVVVKDAPFEFDRSKNVQSFGKQFGRSDRKQHENYVRYIDGLKQDKRSCKLSGRKQDIEWLGTMPGEMADSIGRHEGDKEAVSKDPVHFLKKTGLYEGD